MLCKASMNDLAPDKAGAAASWAARHGKPIAAALTRWRHCRRVDPAWTLFAALLGAVMMLPLATIVVLSLDAQHSEWPHLVRTVLPAALADTALLLVGVGALTLAIG